MQLINIPSAKQIVRNVAIALKEPVMFVGQFGAGKSEGIVQACVDAGAILCDVRLGQYDTIDLRGMPAVNETTGFTAWHPASTLPFVGNDAFPDDKIIVLFLDELTSCTPSVFAVCYQLINEGRIGEHILKPNVRIVCAGNRQSDKGVVNRMPMPLANRMTWFEIGVNVEAWCDYAQEKHWPAEFIGFMQFRKPLLCTYDPAKTETVVATPRTWEKAIKYYKSDMSKELKLAAMAGCVGDGPTGEFWAFIDVWKTITPTSAIIKDPKGVKLPDEPSMQYAQTISVSGDMNVKNITALHTYLLRYEPEFVIMAWQLACKRDKGLWSTPEFVDFARRFKVVFDA